MNYVESFNLFGIEARQIPCITGEGAPTISTEGAVGCFYMDTLTGDVYKYVTGDTPWVLLREFDPEQLQEIEDALATKIGDESLVQTIGDSETAVMSQKAVTDAINNATGARQTFGLVIGDWSISNGVIRKNANANKKCVSPTALVYDTDITIQIQEGYRANVWFCDADMSYQSDLGWSTTTIDVPANTYFVLRVSLVGGDSTVALTEEDRILYNNAVYTDAKWKQYADGIDADINAKLGEANIDIEKNKNDISMMNADVQYKQNPNLYDGEWEVGRYDYTTGAVYSKSSSHCCSKNMVKLDSTKSYNVAVKSGYGTNGIYIYTYDQDKNFIEYKFNNKGLVHITGVGYVNFSVGAYSTDFPNEPLHVMVWESDNSATYTEWLEYGETGEYYKDKLLVKEAQLKDALLSEHKARFDSSFNYVSYSIVNGSDASINTAELFTWAAKQGFTALKGDIQPTSDGKLIMCHDEGFTFNADGDITTYDANNSTQIRTLTEAECLALQHATTQNQICNFDTYIKICKKYGKIAYITIRDKYIEDIVPAMFAVLDKYNMRTRCIVNSFTLTSLQAVRAVDDTITLSQVFGHKAGVTTANIDNAISLGNCMICGFSFPNDTGETMIAESVIEYARANDIRLYEAQVNSMDEIDRLIERGIAGAHMTVAPVF